MSHNKTVRAPDRALTVDGAAAVADLEAERRLLESEEAADQREEVQVRAAVVRGTEPRETLTALVRRQLERRERRQVVESLLVEARALARDQAVQARVTAYDAEVAEAEARHTAAVDEATQIDRGVDQVIAGIGAVRACLGLGSLRHTVFALHNQDADDPRAPVVLQKYDERAGQLRQRVLLRLREAGVVTVADLQAVAALGPQPKDVPMIAAWMAAWISRTFASLRLLRDRVVRPGPADTEPDTEEEP